MSLVELKEQAAGLSLEDRLQLATFLADLEERKETEFRKRVVRRMKNMDRGKKVTAEQFEAQHARRSPKAKR